MKKNTSAFTIVELVVVTAVLGILAGITIVSYTTIRGRAQIASLRSDANSARKQLLIWQAKNNNVYPNSITDCPTPANGNMCMPAPRDSTFYYTQVPQSSSGPKIIANNSYDLGVLGSKQFYYYSENEITSGNEFVQYTDLAPYIDKYGLVKYQLSFDIKSANTANKNTVNVYFQNGSDTRYNGLHVDAPVTTTYARQTITFTPTLANTSISKATLAFYGDYGTGNIASVKNVEFSIAQ